MPFGTNSSCTKWIALFLVLLPLAWPASRLSEVAGGGDSRFYQDRDAPDVVASDTFRLIVPTVLVRVPAARPHVLNEAPDRFGPTYRGPPSP